MKAADIMSTNIVTIDSLATLAEAARIMKQYNLRSLIVERVSENDAYGIITATDISRAIAQAKNPVTTSVSFYNDELEIRNDELNNPSFSIHPAKNTEYPYLNHFLIN